MGEEEIEIVRGLKEGDSQAFRLLYARYSSELLTYLTRLTGRREWGEELTQEALLRALQKIQFFEAKRDGGLKAWVFRISTHLAFDLLRREKKMVIRESDQIPEEGLEADAAFLMEALERDRAVEAAIAQLNPAQRMLVLLREQEGLSHFEISRVCGLSENAVKQGLFRARTELRKILCKTI